MGNGDAACECDAIYKDNAGDRELPSVCDTAPAGDTGRCASAGWGGGDKATSDAEADGPVTGTL